MRREIRGSRLEVIEGAGHVSNVERPAEFNAALTKFLRDLQP
jgi:pimeloyl-ACP methyl ester carboxylesterase